MLLFFKKEGLPCDTCVGVIRVFEVAEYSLPSHPFPVAEPARHSLYRPKDQGPILRIALTFTALTALGVGIALWFGALPLDRFPAIPFDLAAIRTAITTTVAPPPPIRPAPPPVQVVVAAARVADVPITLSGIGTVQAYNSVAVKSHVDGEIISILFTEGQQVEAGAPLALIDPRPFQAQLDQQQANRGKDQALFDGAVLDQQRYDDLVRKNFASHQQVDQQRALVEQYRAQIKTDEAMIDYAKTQLAFTTLRAPLAGRVGIRQVDQGNFIHATDTTPIVTITQLQPISVIFTLPAAAVARARMSLGQVNVPVAAYAADDSTRLDEGVVEMVDNTVDQTTGTIKLKARFANLQTKLWPGDFVNGRLVVDTRHDAVTVPVTALRHGPRGDFVWVIGEDKAAIYRPVTAGQNADGRVMISSGLKRGDQVVTEGHFRLEEKTRVEIIRTEPATPPARARSTQPG